MRETKDAAQLAMEYLERAKQAFTWAKDATEIVCRRAVTEEGMRKLRALFEKHKSEFREPKSD
jgi:hypothetical protein